MGGVNSQNATEIQNDEYEFNQDADDDEESSHENCDQEKQGVWSFFRHFGDEYLFRRRQGADLYDEGKSSSYFLNKNGTANRSQYNVINKRDADGQTSLTRALRSEDSDNLIGNVKYILGTSGIDINYPELQQSGLYSYTEVPPLIVAIKLKKKNLVELLLHNGADVTMTDSNYQSPLYYSAEIGDIDIVSLLLKYGPKLSSAAHSEDPLHAACRHGYKEIVRLLVQSGANIIPRKKSFLTVPFILAVENKHEDVCIFLLDVLKCRHTKNKDSLKEDVLIRACWFGCPRVVQYLINQGININVLSNNNCSFSSHNSTALVHALRPGDIARYDREIRIAHGEHCFLLLSNLQTIFEESVTIINLLCENGVELEHESGIQKMTALILSLRAGNIPAAIVLLKHGAIWDERCNVEFENNNLKRRCDNESIVFKHLIQFLDHNQRYRRKPKKYEDNTRTLQDCCRQVIRSRVSCHRYNSTSILPLLRSLPLPNRVLDFLCYSYLDELSVDIPSITLLCLRTIS